MTLLMKPGRFALPTNQLQQDARELMRASLADDPRSKFIQGVMGLAGIIDGAIRLVADGRRYRCVIAEEVAPQNPETVKRALQLLARYLDK